MKKNIYPSDIIKMDGMILGFKYVFTDDGYRFCSRENLHIELLTKEELEEHLNYIRYQTGKTNVISAGSFFVYKDKDVFKVTVEKDVSQGLHIGPRPGDQKAIYNILLASK